MSMPGQPVQWKVAAQRPDMDLGPAGVPVRGWRITIDLTNGSSGEVFVPDSIYSNQDMVKDLLSQKAMQIASNFQLSGEVTPGS